jgi:hypothetical protein
MFVSQVLDFYTLLNRIYHLYPRNKLETNLIRLAGRWQPKWPSGPSRPTRGQPHAQQAGPHTARGGGARARPSPFSARRGRAEGRRQTGRLGRRRPLYRQGKPASRDRGAHAPRGTGAPPRQPTARPGMAYIRLAMGVSS